MLRMIGGAFILIGLILTLTVMGAAIGIPLMLVGLLFVVVGRGKRTVVVHVKNDGTKG